jgi:alcohol dehydrogenase
MGACPAAVLEGVGRISIRSFDLPPVGLDEALLRVELVGVCGTDFKYFQGKLNAPYPIILGHEILGRIAAIGERAAARYELNQGDRVVVESSIPCGSCESCVAGQYRFCPRSRGYGTRTSVTEPPGLWGGMAEYMYLAPGSVLHRLPDSIPPRTAVVAGVVANGIQWLRLQGGVSVGDRVLIQGAGPQGLAATTIGRECGAGTIIVTGLAQDAGRLELARELGADYTIVADEEDVVERVRELTEGQLADVVLDVTGSPRAVQASVRLVRRLGTLVLAGLTGAGVETPLELDHLAWNEIRVQGVFSKGAQAVSAAINFLATRGRRYPLDRIVSHVYPLEQAESAIRAAGGAGDADFIKAAIAP